ncbi:MAG TPA: hypothetical protein VFV19_16275 [Candidatus Polarisedimenticolaceae bacterium]|nr:hypothetical protein [Candidatus Polarisedimenticolaceae bacterium]
MDEHGPFSGEEGEFLRALLDEGVEFLVVGLAAAALQGAQAVTQDVDLWFRDLADPGIQRALRRVGGIYVPPTGSTPPLLSGRAVAPFDIVLTMHGLRPFEDEAAGARRMLVDGIPLRLLPLDRIIASKKAARRPKDFAILPALEAAAHAESIKKPPRAATRRSARPKGRR